MKKDDAHTRRLATCVNFNGIQHDECGAGIAYASVREKPGVMPCLPPFRKGEVCKTTCEKFRAHTPEEIVEQDHVTDDLLAEFFLDIKAGRCTVCHQPATREQVGQCVYGRPCGHRMYQGKA